MTGVRVNYDRRYVGGDGHAAACVHVDRQALWNAASVLRRAPAASARQAHTLAAWQGFDNPPPPPLHTRKQTHTICLEAGSCIQ